MSVKLDTCIAFAIVVIDLTDRYTSEQTNCKVQIVAKLCTDAPARTSCVAQIVERRDQADATSKLVDDALGRAIIVLTY